MILSVSKASPHIYIIFGASGSGKTTLVQQIEALYPTASIHVKGTDRKTRQYDGDEILCKSKVRPEEYDYIYSLYGHKYGIQRAQIDEALKNGKHHFIICNDITTIEAIKRQYPGKVRVVFLQFDAPKKSLQAIHRARGISDDELSLRLEKMEVLRQLFVERNDLFDAAIINKFGAPPSMMLSQLKAIISSEDPRSFMKPEEMHARLMTITSVVENIQRHLQEQVETANGVIQDNYLFILMAMLRGDPRLEDTHAAIKRAAQRLGLQAERADEIAHTDQITNKVLGSIRLAEYIVADLTHERPNVYYELGYAHAFGKIVILTARRPTKLHFDVQNYPVIFYESGVQLENDLVKLLGKLEEQRVHAERQEHDHKERATRRILG